MESNLHDPKPFYHSVRENTNVLPELIQKRHQNDSMFASSYSAASGKKQSDGSPLPSIKSNKLKAIPIVPEIEVDPGSDLGGSSMREENSLANYL